jgi:hypothetical protein
MIISKFFIANKKRHDESSVENDVYATERSHEQNQKREKKNIE